MTGEELQEFDGLTETFWYARIRLLGKHSACLEQVSDGLTRQVRRLKMEMDLSALVSAIQVQTNRNEFEKAKREAYERGVKAMQDALGKEDRWSVLSAVATS